MEIAKTNRTWTQHEFSQFTSLFETNALDQFSQAVSHIASDYRFERYILRLVPNKYTSMQKAFVVTNYDIQWRKIYDDNQYYDIDPIIQHAYSNHLPLF